MRRSTILALTAIVALVVGGGVAMGATTASFTVPGTADPWLAGMPDGSTASFDGNSSDPDDTAPAQSPTEVTGLNLTAGGVLKFAASGEVSFTPEGARPPDPPDGISINKSSYYNDHPPLNSANHYNDYPTLNPENGISDINAPVNALIGVFLGPKQPDDPSLPAPPNALDFGTESSRHYSNLEPEVRQMFFIGDGLTSSSQQQSINIPQGATRLFLGTMDGVGWWNNSGSFDVQVDHTPPAPACTIKPDGKVVFGVEDQTASNPELSCNELPDSGGVVSPAQFGGILVALAGGLAVLGVAFVARQRLS